MNDMMEENNQLTGAILSERAPEMQDAREVAFEAAAAFYRKKGIDIKMFRVDDRTVIADYYVICVGRAITHMRALADEAIYRLGLRGVRSLRTEGEDGNEWVLVDFGDVILHIFSRDAREYYNLERLLNPEGEVELTEFFEQLQNKLTEEGAES